MARTLRRVPYSFRDCGVHARPPLPALHGKHGRRVGYYYGFDGRHVPYDHGAHAHLYCDCASK